MGHQQVLQGMTARLVASYDESIAAVGEVIQKSLEMLDQSRHVEQGVQSQLKETLAKVESLRKKDFEALMAPIVAHQERREQEIRRFLTLFLHQQRELAGQLKKVIQAGILSRVPDLGKSIHNTIEEAKAHVIGFQKEQALIAEKVQSLCHKKDHLTLKELKQTVEILTSELGLDQSGQSAVSANGDDPAFLKIQNEMRRETR